MDGMRHHRVINENDPDSLPVFKFYRLGV